MDPVADRQGQEPDVDGKSAGAVARPFTAVLAEFDDGVVVDLLSQELHTLTEQVTSSGRTGKLTLEITLSPLNTSRSNAIEAKAKVTVTPPKSDPHTSIYFTDKLGNLTRRDERAETLPVVRLAGGTERA